MTDKQIIIDGIDISGCEFYWRKKLTCYCQENKDCLYKKYKHKEQECEELTSQKDKFEFGNNILEHERNKYKQALDEIEHQVTELFLGVENKDRTYCKKILDIINSVKDKNVPHKAKDGE